MAIDWGRLRRTADRQCDLLTHQQCRAAGMSDAMMRWRVTSGRWVRLHQGVFLTKPGRQDWEVTAMAALLGALSGAAEADAALCGRSAAYVWGLEQRPPRALELVVPYHRSVRGSVTGRSVRVRRSLRWADLVDDREFPWRTTRAATVLDVARDRTATDALSLVARAVQKELVTVAELRQELARRAGHRYSLVLRPALDDVDDGGQSGAELLYIRDVERAHGLPTATRQSPSDREGRRYHDHEYEPWRLIVEVDGRLGHERWSDRVRDGQRDRQLLTDSRLTTRVFWTDVAVRPCATAADLATILRQRGWTGAARRCRRRSCTVKAPGTEPEDPGPP